VSAMFVVALSVPAASMLFDMIQWCCWHDRKLCPGEAQWHINDLEKANGSSKREKPAEV